MTHTRNTQCATRPLLYLLAGLLLFSNGMYAQYHNQRAAHIQYNRNWIFGWTAGIDFRQSPPLSFTTNLITAEGAAVVSDPVSGNLLFYTGGREVYDRTSAIMQNGHNLSGNRWKTTSQGSCIIPVPGDPHRYYLFTLEDAADTGRLYYSVIDMSLNNGLGAVTNTKNVYLDSGLSEAMIAVPGNNCDVWLIVHARRNPQFKAYRLHAGGLDSNPVVSDTGPWPRSGYRVSNSDTTDAFGYCLMQAAPDRSMIAIGSSVNTLPALLPGRPAVSGVMLCRFDPSTGVVSDPLLLGEASSDNFSFSPDNRLLYIAYPEYTKQVSELYQYDITSYDSASIVNSGMLIQDIPNPYNTGNPQYTRMRLYNDTIYLSNFQSEAVHRINAPDTRGTGCGFQMNALMLQSNTYSIAGFSMDVIHALEPDTVHFAHDTFICPGQTITLQPHSNTPFIWEDGSSAAERRVSSPGLYYVTGHTECPIRVDSFRVRFQPGDTSFQVLLDTLLCHLPETIELAAPPGYPAYRWSTSAVTPAIRPDRRGVLWVLSDSFCTARIDTFILRGADVRFSLGGDRMFCQGYPFPLSISLEGTYLWQDGSTNRDIMVTGTGLYHATVQHEGCTGSDTVRVDLLQAPQELGSDIAVCRDSLIEITLHSNVPSGAFALWNDGRTETSITVQDTGTYAVDVCGIRDTIRIFRETCTCELLLPDAFTPNGDGRNDVFRPMIPGGCEVSGFRMHIYNRWGALVFASDQPGQGWDGMLRQGPAETGTYMYEILSRTGTQEIQKLYKGDLILIR